MPDIRQLITTAYQWDNEDEDTVLLIRQLAKALELVTVPAPGEHTLDEVWAQNEQILAIGAGNNAILRSVADEYHRAIEEEAAAHEEEPDTLIEDPRRTDRRGW